MLHVLFALDGIIGSSVLFEINELIDAVALCVAPDESFSMLVYAAHKITGNANV
jgi:hypothetical protein